MCRFFARPGAAGMAGRALARGIATYGKQVAILTATTLAAHVVNKGVEEIKNTLRTKSHSQFFNLNKFLSSKLFSPTSSHPQLTPGRSSKPE